MQESVAIPGSVDLSNRYSSGEFDEFSKLSQDYTRKIRVNYYVTIAEGEEKHEHEDCADHVVIEEEEEEEFSFASANLEESSISAEEVFQDGQIRPLYPIFDQSLLYAEEDGGDSNNSEISTSCPRPPLKKLFVEERDGASSSETGGGAVGPYCEWSRKVVETSSCGECKKSNSTGFSKRWRFRDLVHRSSSDGKDAYVFLNSDPVTTKSTETEEEKRMKRAVTSAHEMHYVRNRAIREEDRRRSYLPYRQGLVGVGFFTSVSGFTKNVHPY